MTKDDSSIVVISQYFPPETGAAPTRWHELTDRWVDDASVTVITSAPDYPEGKIYDGYENRWLQREQHGNVNVLYTKTITSSSGDLVRRGIKFVWFMLLSFIVGLWYTSPKAVIATSPQPLTGVSAWLLARLKGAQFVFEIRDLWPESILAVSDFENRAVIWLLDRTIMFLYRRADTIVVVSQAFIQPIVETGVDRSKIEYYPNGVDLEFYDVSGTRPEALDEFDNRPTVAYVGTIGRAHGLSVVLDAAPDVPDVQFVLVGDGSEREKLEQQAENHENIIFTGRWPKEQVPYILAEADIGFVHLKPREIFETVIPSKLLESMAAGLPVILGVRGEAQQIVQQADAGITMEPGNATELVAAIGTLRQKEQRAKLGNNGREYVVEEFNWNDIAARYLALLKNSS